MYEGVESEENNMSPIVYMPPKKHDCKPPEDVGLQKATLGPKYPAGTIWKCDDCGSRWEMEHEYYASKLYGDTEGRYRTVEMYWNRLDD